jgi:hypothetical protein
MSAGIMRTIEETLIMSQHRRSSSHLFQDPSVGFEMDDARVRNLLDCLQRANRGLDELRQALDAVDPAKLSQLERPTPSN